MTIGKSSKKNKAPRSPPFLDRASGFYGRLDETETQLRKEAETSSKEPATKTTVGETSNTELADEQVDDIFEFNQGMMEDDGATLLQRKPSRLSRRWSRKSSRRTKAEQNCPNQESNGTETERASAVDQNLDLQSESIAEERSTSRAPEPILVHFSIREDADDQALILGKKENLMEMEENKRGGEMEGKTGGENMKVMKRSALRNYRKAFDRALRRGWETFVANLYSVTLTPISSSSSSPPNTSTLNRNIALAEFR